MDVLAMHTEIVCTKDIGTAADIRFGPFFEFVFMDGTVIRFSFKFRIGNTEVRNGEPETALFGFYKLDAESFPFSASLGSKLKSTPVHAVTQFPVRLPDGVTMVRIKSMNFLLEDHTVIRLDCGVLGKVKAMDAEVCTIA